MLLASWLLYVEVSFSPFELTNCFIERGKGTASSGEVCRDYLYFLSPLQRLNRKQIPVCTQCHQKIHRGEYDGIRLSDLAYNPYESEKRRRFRESRMR